MSALDSGSGCFSRFSFHILSQISCLLPRWLWDYCLSGAVISIREVCSFTVAAFGGIVFAVLGAGIFRVLLLFRLVRLCTQATSRLLDALEVVVAKSLAVLALVSWLT